MAQKYATPKSADKIQQQPMVFQKDNYRWLLIAIAVVIAGFLLMTGTEGDIYDFRRIVLAPVVVLIGFAIGFYAILKKREVK